MSGRSSPILSPKRKNNRMDTTDEDDSLYRYSPMSSPSKSPLSKHREMGFYASPTSSTRSMSSSSSNNNGGPPPAYMSPDRDRSPDNKSINSYNTNRSQESKYSTLMQYLDTEITGNGNGNSNGHNHQDPDRNTDHEDEALSEEEKLGMSTYGEESTVVDAMHDENEDEDDITAISSMSLSPKKQQQRHDHGHGFTTGGIYPNTNRGNYNSGGSGASAATSRLSSGRNYIWDDFGNDDRSTGTDIHGRSSSNHGGTGASNTGGVGVADDELTAYFSINDSNIHNNSSSSATGTGTGTGLGSDSGSGTVVTNDSNTSLNTIITQVTNKIKNIKNDIQIKNKKQNDLQCELTRVHTARKRRLLKFKNEYENKLNIQKAEQDSKCSLV